MRMILLSILLTTLTSSQHKPLDSFAFRDWHARDPYSDGDMRFRQCKTVSYGTHCFLSDERIGGVKAKQVGVAFGRKGLFALEAKFESSDAPVVGAALEERYGEPCQKNVSGAVWCFTDGRVTFNLGTPLSDAFLQFKTEDAAKQMAVVNF